MILSVYPLLVETWAGPGPVVFAAGVMLGRLVGVGGYWTARWGRIPGLAIQLWKHVCCVSGMLHVLSGANQLFYVAALTTAVPAGVVFLGETHPVLLTVALGWVYSRLGRGDRHRPEFSKAVWLLLLALVGAALVVVSQGHGDYRIHWLGVAFALAQALLVVVKLVSQLWWAATRAGDTETAGCLFLGMVSDLLLGVAVLVTVTILGGFNMAAFLGGAACGLFGQAVGNVLHRTANVVSATPNINVLLLAMPPAALVWLWLFGGDVRAHWGLLLAGGTCLTFASVMLNRPRRTRG